MSNLPWFWPAFAVWVVVGLAASGPVGRALGARRILAWALVVSVGVVLSATLTPLAAGRGFAKVGTGSCDLTRIGLAPLGALFTPIGDARDNIALFVPLGVTIGLLPRSRGKVFLILAAVALPFAVEGIQLVVTVLDRACESADIVDNLTGLVVGLALGAVGGWVAARWARKAAPDDEPGAAAGATPHVGIRD